MTTEETAANICEFAVARLDVEPGDVVVVRVKDAYDDDCTVYRDFLNLWKDQEGLDLHFLVLPDDVDITTIIHSLTPEEVEKAGAGGWPHEKETT